MKKISQKLKEKYPDQKFYIWRTYAEEEREVFDFDAYQMIDDILVISSSFHKCRFL